MKFLTSKMFSAWFFVLLISNLPSTAIAEASAEAPPAASETVTDDDKAPAFPLSASFGLGNSVGLGTFMPDYQRMPSWGSSMSVSLGLNLPQMGFWPGSSLSVGSSASVPWLYSYRSGGNANLNQMLVSDTRVNYSLGSIWKSEFLGLNLGFATGASLPTSLRSRYNNLGTSLRVSTPFSFKKAGFSVSWNPSFAYNIYTQENPLTQQMYSEEDTSRLLIVCRPEEVLGDDSCLRKGRPTDFSLSNSFSLGYGIDQHSFGLSLSWGLGFQRALSEAPELTSEYASDQNFGESVVGGLSYGYGFEAKYLPKLGLSMTTGQSPYTPMGEPRFWFFDFLTPSNNLTQFGLNLGWRI